MKHMYVLLFLTSFIFACSSDDDIIIAPSEDLIEFTGTWTRQFEAGPGNLHTVTYKIYQDSIRYTLEGPIGQANYKMNKDIYSLEENRFVGHNPENDQYYVLFFKNVTAENLTLYKKEVTDEAEGTLEAIPADDDTDNHGWNTYELSQE